MELFITFILGFFILIGALVAALSKNSKFIEHVSIAVAFGAMAALAALELAPEAAENLGADRIWVLFVCIAAGILLLKVLDLFVPEHHHHHRHGHDCRGEEEGCCTQANVGHIGIVSAVAVTLHNVIEGMAVYSVAAGSLKVGLLMALGVGLHNIPMGMVICSTLQREKPVKKILFISLAALSTFAGGLAMMLLWQVITELVIGILIGLTLGMLVYIVLFELLPHLVAEKNFLISLAGASAGIVLILISCLLG